jgi:NADH:ubiquinone oxidoreductase subunit 6 (subunit J)
MEKEITDIFGIVIAIGCLLVIVGMMDRTGGDLLASSTTAKNTLSAITTPTLTLLGLLVVSIVVSIYMVARKYLP